MSTYDPTIPVYDGTLLPMGNVLQVFNVRQYGAKGDGVNDDSTAFQHAANAAQAAGGGVVWVPATPSNNYAGSTTITFASGVSCLLARADTTHPPLSVTAGTLALSGAYVTRAGGANGTATAPLPWFNVKDYGAVGDGTTDDTTAIQAALTAVPTAGGVLYFPDSTGDYICGPLAGRSNLLVVGPGLEGPTVKQKAGTSAGPFDWGSYPSLTNVNIRDLTLDGNKANVTGGRGIQWVTSSLCRAVRVRVINSFYQGIFGFQCTDCVVIECETDSTGASATTNGVGMGIAFNAGVRIRVIGNRSSNANDAGIGGAGTACTDSLFNDNVVVSAGFIGMAMASGGARNTITGNVVKNAGNNGIDIANCTDTSIVGNVVDAAATGGIVGDGAIRYTVSGNTVVGTAANVGIYITNSAQAAGIGRAAVTGNSVYNTAGHGILLTSVERCTVTGNEVVTTTSSGDGIRLTNGASVGSARNIVNANSVTGAAGWGINEPSNAGTGWNVYTSNQLAGNTSGAISTIAGTSISANNQTA